MAKPQEAVKTEEPQLPQPALPPINSFEAVLAEYGVTENDTYVPVPPTTVKANLPELCILTTQLKDQRGEPIKDVLGHTGPLMFLAKGDQYDGEKFEGYDGFYTFYVLHPKKGKTVLTIGRPKGENQPQVIVFLKQLRKGAWFQVARIKTSAGFGVLVPVPVQ